MDEESGCLGDDDICVRGSDRGGRLHLVGLALHSLRPDATLLRLLGPLLWGEIFFRLPQGHHGSLSGYVGARGEDGGGFVDGGDAGHGVFAGEDGRGKIK